MLTSIVENQEAAKLKEELDSLETQIELKDEEIFQLKEQLQSLEDELGKIKGRN